MYRLFLTTAWTGSGEPFEHVLPNGETALVYQTLLNAYDAAEAGDIIQPAPPGTPGFCFCDAFGEPLQTVVVNLGANWTINKSITLQGGWCRLRFDGSSDGYGVRFSATGGATAIDCDFISGAVSLNICTAASLTATRCRFANYRTPTATVCGYTSGNVQTYEDCLFVNCVSTHASAAVMGGTSTARRCTIYACSRCLASQYDMVIARPVNGTVPGVAPGDTFVGDIPDDPTSVTDWSGAVDWDFRIKSTSPYATGGTSVTSGQKVYDLAGTPRKVGGALGAYECLSDVTHWQRETAYAWYTFERESDSAPDVLCVAAIIYAGAKHINALFDKTATRWQYRTSADRDWTGGAVLNTKTLNAVMAWTDGRQIRVTADGESWTVITLYQNAPPSDALTPRVSFANRYSFSDISGTTAVMPSAASVCYFDSNADFVSSQATIAKAYVANGARVDFGDATIGELVLGLNAEAKTTGKVTLKNQTSTSAAIFSQLKPTAPAEVTFKECAISDSASE